MRSHLAVRHPVPALRVILRLPRGGPRVCDCSKLCLLAIFLVESELALILVVTLRRGCSARVAVLGLGRFEFAAASQSKGVNHFRLGLTSSC